MARGATSADVKARGLDAETTTRRGRRLPSCAARSSARISPRPRARPPSGGSPTSTTGSRRTPTGARPPGSGSRSSSPGRSRTSSSRSRCSRSCSRSASRCDTRTGRQVAPTRPRPRPACSPGTWSSPSTGSRPSQFDEVSRAIRGERGPADHAHRRARRGERRARAGAGRELIDGQLPDRLRARAACYAEYGPGEAIVEAFERDRRGDRGDRQVARRHRQRRRPATRSRAPSASSSSRPRSSRRACASTSACSR